MRKARAKEPRLIRDSFLELMKGVSTCIPGHILTFDPATQLAQVQVGIQRVDINGAAFSVPPIIQVPVHFPGGDYCVEYQIDPGCEGLIHFSQRCVDGWLQAGGIAANPIGRFFSAQDAFFAPGYRPLPDAIPSFQNNGVRLRNRAGTQSAWLKNDGSISLENGAGYVRIAADGTVTINGATITTSGDVISASGIHLNTHKHGQVQPGTGTSGVPVP